MTNELDLVVTNQTVGVLDTNISAIENFVSEKLKEYTPENYNGDADSAKKDRAELNNSKKFLQQKRIQIITELMKPYTDFETRCKKVESNIDSASRALDVIVKARENEEKEAKRKLIEDIWESKKFTLVPMDSVFNQKWLNKTTKLTDVESEIDTIINRIYSDLKTIEKYSEDSDTLKAHYLDCLNISDTLDYGEQLQKNREKIAQEKAAREQREHEQKIAEQRKEVSENIEDISKSAVVENLVNEALDIEPKTEINEYVISVKVSDVHIAEIKNYLTMQGIEYECKKISF